MGQGLGRNSPVQLSLGRENYEALIERHGQWIRWRVANKCACLNPNTFQPDIHCKLCGGRGVTYTYQPEQIVQTVTMSKSNDGLLQIDKVFENDELIKVYDSQGIEYEAEKNGTFIIMNEKDVHKSNYYNVLCKRKSLIQIDKAEMKYDNGYWTVQGMESSRANIDGVYYSAPGDIISVEKIVDSLGEEFEADEFRLNKILLKEKTMIKKGYDDEGNLIEDEFVIDPIAPLYAVNVNYIAPFTFALLSQNLNKGDFEAMVEAQGDAVCSFPYSCDVAESDVLTVLAGTITQKDVMAKTGGKADPLPAFFVAEIVSITGSDGTVYRQGEDYVLYGTNSVKWVDDCLETGEGYSVIYKVYPTYTVVKNIPQLRSSENQRFPKKAVVKFMTSYSDKRKVNRQL